MRNIQTLGTSYQKLAKAMHSGIWGVDSNLKWLLLFSPDEAGELDGTSLIRPLSLCASYP